MEKIPMLEGDKSISYSIFSFSLKKQNKKLTADCVFMEIALYLQKIMNYGT